VVLALRDWFTTAREVEGWASKASDQQSAGQPGFAAAPYPPPASRCAVLRRAASPAGDCGPLENLTRESDLMRGLAPIVQKATCYPAQSLNCSCSYEPEHRYRT